MVHNLIFKLNKLLEYEYEYICFIILHYVLI